MKTFIFLFFTTVFSLSPSNIISQNSKVIIDADTVLTVDEVFSLIKQQTKYKFIYQQGIFDNFPKIRLKKGKIQIRKLLEQSLSNGNFKISISEDDTILVQENLSVKNKASVIKPKIQGVQISGTVTSELGPLPGANIVVKGTNNGTTTDFDGNYSINANQNQTLQFSYVGYETKEILVGNQTTINVNLLSDNQLDQIVLVGYGSVKKSDLTGSVSSVDTDGIEDIPQVSVILMPS
tara:strand:- start:24 stop:731 length:708 start_codon:yes stop_codon:yes gene_type:complete